ncbi:hypothetical protein ABH945_003462 [Paraburkholderia sp. GAS333]|uniref:hypothetical protein n=1 Tax=Paraburkholderia sp. GAS333 TaxID=3156279 RepID=UPI003D1B63F8
MTVAGAIANADFLANHVASRLNLIDVFDRILVVDFYCILCNFKKMISSIVRTEVKLIFVFFLLPQSVI